MRRASSPLRPSSVSTGRDTPGTPEIVDEERRQRWIAETTAAFLAAGAQEPNPTESARRRAFRRAALSDERLPSRRDEWSNDLLTAFEPSEP